MTARRAAWATLVAVAALLLGTAGPATAEPPTVTIAEPGDGAVLRSPEGRISGEVHERDLDRVTGSITAVVITVSSPSGRSECSTCWSPNGPDATFSWSRSLDFNGPYSVSVKVTSTDLVAGPETGEAQRSFKVEAPPAAPKDVTVEAGPDRRVTISWARNTEPDLKSYQVSRVGPGGSEASVVTVVSQPPSGSRVSTVDGALPPAGGTYAYVVTAMRPDRDGKVTSRAIAPSSPVSVEVAAGPTEGAGPGAGAAAPATGPGPLGGPAGARGGGGVPFSLGGEQTLPAVPGGEVLPTDDGFALPGAEGSGSADPAVLDDSSSVGNQRAIFVPIAAVLLLCVLAFHLRQFDRAVLSAPPAYHPLIESDDGEGGGDEYPDEAGAGDGGARTAVLVGAARPPREG